MSPSSQRHFTRNKQTKICFYLWVIESRGWWNLVRLAKVTVKELLIHTCEVGVVWGINEIVRKGLRHIFIQIQFLRWNNSIFFSTQIAHKSIHWYLSWRKWRVMKSVNVFFLWVVDSTFFFLTLKALITSKVEDGSHNCIFNMDK